MWMTILKKNPKLVLLPIKFIAWFQFTNLNVVIEWWPDKFTEFLILYYYVRIDNWHSLPNFFYSYVQADKYKYDLQHYLNFENLIGHDVIKFLSVFFCYIDWKFFASTNYLQLFKRTDVSFQVSPRLWMFGRKVDLRRLGWILRCVWINRTSLNANIVLITS